MEMQIEKKSTRNIEDVTSEVKELKRQAANMALIYVVEIGRRLAEAKSILPHGEWGNWLQNEVEFSQATANNYMKLFEEYGNAQLSFFGTNLNSELIGNLSYTKALKLLAVPSDEREEFAESVDAEHCSVKELEKAIEERNQALKQAEEERKRADEMESALKEAAEAAETVKTATEEIDKIKSELVTAKESAEKGQSYISELKKQLEEAKNNPSISDKELKKIKSEAAAKAKEAAQKELEAKLTAAELKLQTAEKLKEEAESRAERAKQELEETKKALKTSSPEIAAFKSLFDSMQTTAQKLKAMVEKIRESDSETADKLSAALHALGEKL